MPTYYLPPVFFNDHTARDLPEKGESVEVGTKGKQVVVEMDDDAFRDLYTDADYHTDRATAQQMAEMGEQGLTASARATLKALRKQNPDLCASIDADLAEMRRGWMTGGATSTAKKQDDSDIDWVFQPTRPEAAERQGSMTETATKPKMVGVGRGVKVPAEFKDAYVAAREEMEAAYKDEAKLAKKGKTEGDEQYDAAVKRVGRAHNTLTAVVDQIRKAIGAPGVQPPPPRPGTTMDDDTKAKLKEAKRADAKANGRVVASEDEGLAGYAPHGPGWDAKAKSDLINSALGLKFEPKVQKFSVDEAVAILERIPQWKPFYERKLAATSEATDEHDAAVKSGQ